MGPTVKLSLILLHHVQLYDLDQETHPSELQLSK